MAFNYYNKFQMFLICNEQFRYMEKDKCMLILTLLPLRLSHSRMARYIRMQMPLISVRNQLAIINSK